MKDRDHLNRPVVVVTGMGVLTALGEGLAENWRRLTAGEPGSAPSADFRWMG